MIICRGGGPLVRDYLGRFGGRTGHHVSLLVTNRPAHHPLSGAGLAS